MSFLIFSLDSSMCDLYSLIFSLRSPPRLSRVYIKSSLLSITARQSCNSELPDSILSSSVFLTSSNSAVRDFSYEYLFSVIFSSIESIFFCHCSASVLVFSRFERTARSIFAIVEFNNSRLSFVKLLM